MPSFGTPGDSVPCCKRLLGGLTLTELELGRKKMPCWRSEVWREPVSI